jgi:hypothetical protein
MEEYSTQACILAVVIPVPFKVPVNGSLKTGYHTRWITDCRIQISLSGKIKSSTVWEHVAGVKEGEL